MKTVFKSNEIAHVWANQGAPMGRCPSSMSFDGDAFRSYSTVIARRIRHKGKVAYVLDEASFSVTTSQHQGAVRHALADHPEKVFHVHCGRRFQSLEFTPAQLRDYYVAEFKDAPTDGKPVEPSRYAHKRAQEFLIRVKRLESAIEVCDYFHLPASKLKQTLGKLRGEAIEAGKIVEAYNTKRAQRRNARREAEAVQCAEAVIAGTAEIESCNYLDQWLDNRPDLLKAIQELRIAKDKEAIEAWRNGQSSQCKHEWPVMLRAEENELVTTKGARVPLNEAERTFRFCMAARKRGWHRNGDQHRIGMYQLDAVNEFGVVAGCHRVAWEEIERFAKTQEWL